MAAGMAAPQPPPPDAGTPAPWPAPAPTAAPVPPPGGYPPPAPGGEAGSVPPSPMPGPVETSSDDPNGLGVAASRLGGSPRKQSRIALAVAGAILEPGELVEALVAGRLDDHPAVLVLTDRALLLADERQWKPVAERLALDPSLQVQGWQDDKTASLTLLSAGRQLVVERIADRPMAVEMAQRIRARTGG